MATTKKITEAQALAIAIAIAKGEDMETLCTEAGFTVEEYAKKLVRMHETRTKKREKDPNAPKAKTKERIANEGLAKEAARVIAEHGEPVGSKWVMEHVNYVTSTQKVTSVMKVADELGLIVRGKDSKGNITYDVFREETEENEETA